MGTRLSEDRERDSTWVPSVNEGENIGDVRWILARWCNSLRGEVSEEGVRIDEMVEGLGSRPAVSSRLLSAAYPHSYAPQSKTKK